MWAHDGPRLLSLLRVFRLIKFEKQEKEVLVSLSLSVSRVNYELEILSWR